MAIGSQRLEGPVTYVPELSAPEGESTGGGKQALQHVKLVPDGGVGTTLVMGTANTLGKVAELRTFASLAEQHRRRFKGAAPPVERARYDELLSKVQAFFHEREFHVVLLEAAAIVAVVAILVLRR